MNPRLLSLTALLAFTTFAPAQQTGLTYERWNNLPPGNSILTLERDGIAKRSPDQTGITSHGARYGPNLGDNYGVRLRGTLTPPATGNYTFYVAGDDSSDVWLSASDTSRFDIRRIAFSSSWTALDQWNRHPSQRSQTVFLTAGQPYPIEARMREGSGGDHLSVGWHYDPVTPAATSAVGTPVHQDWPSLENGDIRLSVSAGDIWGTADRFSFHHRPWTGDGEVIARVHDLNSPHPWAKIGLMFRAGTGTGAANAMVARTSANGEVFQRRRSAAADSTNNSAGSSSPWLKLTRQGDAISAFVSADGINWSPAGSDTFPGLPATLEVGIAASNHASTSPVTATISDFAVRPLVATEIIPAAHLSPLTVDPDDLDDDGLPDAWADSHGITHPGEPVNWSLQAGASATQSTTDWGGDASRAIDGNPNGNYSAGSVTHTANESGAWWRCNLGEPQTIARIVIHNRDSFQQRLSNYRVSVLNNTGSPVATSEFHTSGTHAGIREEWSLPSPLTGSTVLIERIGPDSNGENYLSLAEVEIFNHCPATIAKRYGRHGDFDNDGIDNLTEYQLGSDPTTKQTLPGVLTLERWLNIDGIRVADLTTNRARFLADPCERAHVTPFLEINYGDYYATRHRGCITPTRTGLHTFWISADDQAELWLAPGTAPRAQPLTNRYGKQLIASVTSSRAPGTYHTSLHDFDAFPAQRSRSIHLTAGVDYYLEVLHKEGAGSDHLALAWQPPGQARSLIPASAFSSDIPEDDDGDDDNLPAAWESQHNLNPRDNGLNNPHDGQYGDPDGDGLTNLQEYQYGTNPRNADTDGDGVSDYDEIFHYGTDPTVSNLLQNTLIPNQPSPQQYDPAATTGGWTANSDGTLSAWDRRGEITYTFTTTEPGIHEIILTGAAIGTIRPIERLPLVLSLNGNTIASTELLSENGQPGTLRTLTPLLGGSFESPVTHTLTILHDNYRTARRLRIDSIEINRLGGDDVGGISGIPDWAEQNSRNANALTRIINTSRTSPLSIEGITQNLAPTTLTYTPPGASVAIPPDLTPSINDSFFTDIPLSKSGPTVLTASFLGGILPPETHSITWIPTNLFEFDEGELHIRQDDSLLLDAWSGTASDGQLFTITLDSVPLEDEAENTTHTSGQPFAFEFDTPGTHTLTATHADQTATLTLHVHAADFGPAPSVRAYSPRDWTPTLLAPSHLVETDERLTLAETTADPESGPRTFRAAVHHAGNRHVIARLPHNVDGAPSGILARGTVHGFYLAYLDETTDAEIIHRYDDGTWLMRGSMVAVNLPPDILISLTSIFQGTVFVQPTSPPWFTNANTLWLDHAFFDPNGISTIYYEWAGTGSPRLCNRLHLFLKP